MYMVASWAVRSLKSSEKEALRKPLMVEEIRETSQVKLATNYQISIVIYLRFGPETVDCLTDPIHDIFAHVVLLCAWRHILEEILDFLV